MLFIGRVEANLLEVKDPTCIYVDDIFCIGYELDRASNKYNWATVNVFVYLTAI